nr:CD209 antigen-like protein C [Paramormyrops kingsleyae]
MEGDLQQLTSKNRNLTKEKEQIQENHSSLISDNNQLKKNFKAVLDKSHHLTSYCDTTEIQKPCRPCPQGWEPFNSSCYFISMEQKSWKDSRIECLKLGADLVIMESKEEQDFIKGKTDNHWIGLKYNAEKNVWIWLDGRSLRGFPKPSPHFQDENCARSGPTSWEGWPCDTKARWICETRALLLNHL